MNAELHRLVAQMSLGRPATSEAVAQAEVALGMKLPPEYVAFMLNYDGGQGSVGESWARFWPVEELPEMNRLYGELEHLRGWTLFGTNGGGEAFAFTDAGVVLAVPFIGDREDAVRQGSFHEFLKEAGERAEL